MKSGNDIRWLLALVGCVAVLLGAGCGSDKQGKELPRAVARALEAQLQSVQNRLDDGSAGACRDIVSGSSPNTDAVNRILDGLPTDVDSDLRNATRDSFDRLFQLVDQKCAAIRPPTDTNTDTTPTETDTAPTETNTTPTDTNTTPTNTTPTTTSPNDGQQDGQDGGGTLSPGGGGEAAPSKPKKAKKARRG